MLSNNKQHTRICLLEKSIMDFKDIMQQTLESIGGIKNHIDESQKDSWHAMDKMKTEILASIDDKYETKIEMNKTLTSMRTSILKEISEDQDKRRKLSIKTILIISTLMMGTVGGCLWFYENVLSKIETTKKII